MSFRFRRSKKIAPGLRLNFGKRGVSLTAGGKLGRVTFGSSGTTVSSSIPGTGAYYSKRLKSNRIVTGKKVEVSKSDELRDIINSGADVLNPDTGRKYSVAQLNAMLKRLERQEEFDLNHSTIEAEENAYNSIINIHKTVLEIPSENYWKDLLNIRPFTKSNFSVLEPNQDNVFQQTKSRIYEENRLPSFNWSIVPIIPLFAAAMFFILNKQLNFAITSAAFNLVLIIYYIITIAIKRKARKIELDKIIDSGAKLEYEKELGQWRDEKADFESEMKKLEREHNNNEKKRIDEVNSLLNGDIEIIRIILDSEFISIDVPFETEIAFEIISPEVVFLDVDLPEIEDCITTTAKTVLKSGKIKERNKTQKQQKEEYASLVMGYSFYLASHVYNFCPTVKSVIVSGYTQRVNKANGNTEDQYVYSINIIKEQFKTINFEKVNPILAFENFEAIWNMKKSYELKEIKPFEIGDRHFNADDTDNTI